MKTLINLVALASIGIIVAGCGGAESGITTSNNATSNNATTNNEITPTVTTDSHELIINNGRGTTNNQDTERADKNLTGSH